MSTSTKNAYVRRLGAPNTKKVAPATQAEQVERAKDEQPLYAIDASSMVEADVVEEANPFGLPAAPRRAPKWRPAIDLGTYDEEYTGTLIIINHKVPLPVWDEMKARQAEMKAAAERGEDVNTSEPLVDTLRKVAVGWNMRDPLTGKPLPQPRDGGAECCPIDAYNSIFQAFAEALTPKKAGATA